MPRSYDTKCICHNHLPVLPEHIVKATSNLSDEVMNEVEILCDIGSRPTEIVEFVNKKYKTTITADQITKVRSKMVDHILTELDYRPSDMSAADKLIAMFRHDPHVSYIYVMHEPSAGFVTYRKSGTINAVISSHYGVSEEFC